MRGPAKVDARRAHDARGISAPAAAKKLVAYDIMTERFEITNLLQRELVNDPALFGRPLAGTSQDPGVYIESVHHLMKMVAGAPNIRPAWFFDVAQQGEGLADVGTHLVDLVQWTLFPEQALDYTKDIQILAAQRWPTLISHARFTQVTGEPDFPPYLRPHLASDDSLEYFCNTQVTYALRGIQVKINAIWDWEPPPGGSDTHYAVYRGNRARIEVRQGKAEEYRPELYIVPNRAKDKPQLLAAGRKRLSALAASYPDLAVEDRGGELRLVIPAKYRVGHEAHFAEVTRRFLQFLREPGQLPPWEAPNMLAKYYITATGTELSQRAPSRVPPRLAP